MRVTFDFAGAREVHYLRAAPEVGDLVTHQRELWVVSRIEEDGAGTLIKCEPSRPASNESIT